MQDLLTQIRKKENTMSKFHGIAPAFYACYDKNGEINPDMVRKFTKHLIKKGVHGLYVGGSSGECIYQSVEERKIVLENVMEEARNRVHALLSSFLLYPEIDLEWLEKEFIS